MNTAETFEDNGIKSPLRVVLADDNEIVRSSLRLLTQSISNMQVVGEAANGIEAIAVSTIQKPDLVLMDISMPVVDGIEATKVIRLRFPDIYILAVTSLNDNKKIQRILAAGADAYITKHFSVDDLISSINKLMENAVRDRDLKQK